MYSYDWSPSLVYSLGGIESIVGELVKHSDIQQKNSWYTHKNPKPDQHAWSMPSPENIKLKFVTNYFIIVSRWSGRKIVPRGLLEPKPVSYSISHRAPANRFTQTHMHRATLLTFVLAQSAHFVCLPWLRLEEWESLALFDEWWNKAGSSLARRQGPDTIVRTDQRGGGYSSRRSSECFCALSNKCTLPPALMENKWP